MGAPATEAGKSFSKERGRNAKRGGAPSAPTPTICIFFLFLVKSFLTMPAYFSYRFRAFRALSFPFAFFVYFCSLRLPIAAFQGDFARSVHLCYFKTTFACFCALRLPNSREIFYLWWKKQAGDHRSPALLLTSLLFYVFRFLIFVPHRTKTPV